MSDVLMCGVAEGKNVNIFGVDLLKEEFNVFALNPAPRPRKFS